MAGISFSGIASGIDGDAIIKALIEGRRLASAPIEAKVKDNETENTALEEFNTKLLTLNDTLKDFLTLSGGSVSKTAQSSDENVLTATAGSGAVATTTSLTVQQIARTATASFSDIFTDLSAPIAPGLSADGSVDITVGTGAAAETVTVPVTATTTVNDFVAALNTASTGDKYRASVVNVGTTAAPQYKIIVSTTRTGAENGTLHIAPSAELSGLGVLQVGNIQQAEDAIINIDAIGTVSRSTNQISDLIPGVTLNLKAKSAGPIVVSVGTDGDKTAKRLGDMISAFNEVVQYANDNSKIERIQDEDGVSNKFGTLAKTTVDNRAVESLKSALRLSNSDVEGSSVRIFADLGVKTNQDGTLSLDQAKFSEAVAKDPVAVSNVLQKFADRVGATGGVISEYTKFQGTIDTAVKSNTSENDTMSDRLARLEANLEKQSENLKLTFSKLEERISQLNSNASALTSLFSFQTTRS